MAYQTVLVGTDGSTTAELAVVAAAKMARAYDARLVVVTAFKPRGDEIANEPSVPEDIRWSLTDRSLAEEQAARGRELAGEAGAEKVVISAVVGSPADAILESAETFGADLIVVGSIGLTRSARVLLGSVASAVAHHAPCDVLIVETTGDVFASDDTRPGILVGTDGSETAQRAVDRAVEVAKTCGATLTIMSVGPSEASNAVVAGESARLADSGVTIRTTVGLGEPSSAIVTEASEQAYDLLVLGNRGMTGMARWLRLGSVPSKIMHQLPCNLLVVNTT